MFRISCLYLRYLQSLSYVDEKRLAIYGTVSFPLIELQIVFSFTFYFLGVNFGLCALCGLTDISALL